MYAIRSYYDAERAGARPLLVLDPVLDRGAHRPEDPARAPFVDGQPLGAGHVSRGLVRQLHREAPRGRDLDGHVAAAQDLDISLV